MKSKARSEAACKRWADPEKRKVLEQARQKATESRKMAIGTKRLRTDGYVEIKTKQGFRLEHDLVLEHKLGRKLKPNEIAHHKDENKSNNTSDNIELKLKSTHDRENMIAKRAAGKMIYIPWGKEVRKAQSDLMKQNWKEGKYNHLIKKH